MTIPKALAEKLLVTLAIALPVTDTILTDTYVNTRTTQWLTYEFRHLGRRLCEPPIDGNQRRADQLSEGDVGSIVGG